MGSSGPDHDLIPAMCLIWVQILLNKSVDHWTSTSQNVTERLMSQSDLGNAVQQYENPQIEEITDADSNMSLVQDGLEQPNDTEMPTMNEEYNHNDPSEADHEILIENGLVNPNIDEIPPVQEEYIRPEADNEMLGENRPVTPYDEYHDYSLLNVTPRIIL